MSNVKYFLLFPTYFVSAGNLAIVVIVDRLPCSPMTTTTTITTSIQRTHIFTIWYFAIKLDTTIYTQHSPARTVSHNLYGKERKLSKLKNTPNILEQLKARREHCIENLLVGNIDCTYNNADDNRLNEDLESNRRRDLLRYIQPEQPINLGELVTIIHHDQLDQDRKGNSSDDEATK